MQIRFSKWPPQAKNSIFLKHHTSTVNCLFGFKFGTQVLLCMLYPVNLKDLYLNNYKKNYRGLISHFDKWGLIKYAKLSENHPMEKLCFFVRFTG